VKSSPEVAASYNDIELVRRALARDDAAFRMIMEAHNRRLYRIARSITKNDDDAEDIVQEAYIRAFRHLASFRGECSLSTWLCRITINEAVGRMRRERTMVHEFFGALPAKSQIIKFPRTNESGDPEKTMAQDQILRLVESAIDRLPEKFRVVFMARVIEGLSTEETADLFHLRPETVKTRLHRARRLIRDEIENRIGPHLMDAFPFAGSRCARMTDAVLQRVITFK